MRIMSLPTQAAKRGAATRSPLRASLSRSSLSSSAPATAKAARVMILLAVLAIPLMLASPAVPSAYAHPYIEQTIPSTAQNAPAGTGEVVVYFSESVDIEFSEIKVIDDRGERIDNRDLAYYHEDLALAVSTPPLEDGVYTVSTKVLSKVDGHLVPGVFLFGVGEATIDPELLSQESPTELLFLPEAGAELPGIVGQTIIVGAAVAAIAVWEAGGGRRRGGDEPSSAMDREHHKRFMQLTGAGLLLVLASDMMVIALQMARLESGLVETVQTQFGMIWLARMIITMALFGAWFAANRVGRSRPKTMHAAMLAAALALMLTSSMSGHGAATETAEAVLLDYIHNIVAGIWIGGIIYVVFGLLPALSGFPDARERLSLAAIPRFSAIFIVSVGIVIVTGPTLLWTLESDVGMITESMFGRLIILKVAIASVMVGMGGLVQYAIQRRAESDIAASRKPQVHGRLSRTLKVDAALGIALLVVVAVLTNGTLPAGEIRSVEAQQAYAGLAATEFSENVRFDIEITPFATGENGITITASGAGGAYLDDLERIKAKASNPIRGIPPIELDLQDVTRDKMDAAATGPVTYQGVLTLAFSGQWLVEIEAQRAQGANEAVRLDLFARPNLVDMDVTLAEYELPANGTSPLHAAYDHAGSVWFTDASAPRLWQVDTGTGTATPHGFEGVSSSFVTYNEKDRSIWFTDSRGGQIGYAMQQGGGGNDGYVITTIKTPDFESRQPRSDPADEKAVPFFIESDGNGDVWFTVINKGLIARYDVQSEEFEEYHVPGRDSFPFALAEGPGGMMWYTATGTGIVGYINPGDGSLTQVIGPDRPLEAPEALLFEDESEGGGLWITEHTGLAVARFDPVLDTLARYEVQDADALPFGMAFDRYGNVWFAQHTIDAIGVVDPRNGDMAEVEVPTATSFVQFVESDGDGNIWFAEQRGGKVGAVYVSERPSTYSAQGQQEEPAYEVKYADLVSPMMALGVMAASLFYVKAVRDRRRLDGMLMSMLPGERSG